MIQIEHYFLPHKPLPPNPKRYFFISFPHYALMANQICVLKFCLSGCADFVVEIRVLYLSNILPPLIIPPVLP